MKNSQDRAPVCYHCGEEMERLSSPSSNLKKELSWNGDFLWICVNDRCPVFVNGFTSANALSDDVRLFRPVVDPESGACALVEVSPFTSRDIGALLNEPGVWARDMEDGVKGLNVLEKEWSLFPSFSH